MFDTLSIRLKIVLLSGFCLLGVIALIISINLYETGQNDHLIRRTLAPLNWRNRPRWELACCGSWLACDSINS
ncbi:hypothetical protein FEM54_33125, partial [Pseudomonas edaphica]